jgi:hydroxyacylglutathione hydrolase
MKIAIIPVTPFQQNCSLLICDKTRKAAVVDPGGDLELILAEAARLQVSIEKIFVTHGHLDHCSGTQDLREQLGVPVEGPHEDDLFWIEGLPQAAAQYGFPPARSFVPDRWLQGGDTVQFGEITLQVRHCPGHTPGHVIFYEPNVKLAAVGDVLFQGSIGRTDFPRGNHADLIRSITSQLWPLGDDVAFIPGHGPMSTFGHERASNPFVGDDALA